MFPYLFFAILISFPVLFEESDKYKPRNLRLATHELLHWSDCFEMAKLHPGLSEDELMPYVNKWAKEQLDILGINEYNARNISSYALSKYKKNQFFETYVEKRVKDLVGFEDELQIYEQENGRID